MLNEKYDYELSGVIDLHIHTKPDINPRLLDDIQASLAAKSAGMRGILIKSHVVPTADRASIAEMVVAGIRVFGGLVLNKAIGGFNVDAVETAIQTGAKIIWMPTHSAQSMFRRSGKEGGLTVFGEDGSILPVIHEILERIKHANIALATGHLAVDESAALVRLARSMRLQKIIITHPESNLIRMPLDMQQELNGPGVYFERCYLDLIPSKDSGTTIEEIGRHIRATGCDSSFLSTDLGQPGNPSPVEGMSKFSSSLRTIGFTDSEINKMACTTPALLMDMELRT